MNIILWISIILFVVSAGMLIYSIRIYKKDKAFYIETVIENHKQNENLRKLSYPINTDGEMNPLYFAIADTECDINLRFAKKRRKNVN